MYGGSEDWSINEAPISAIPDAAKQEAEGTTPVFFISRTGGEGRDLGRYMGDWTDIEEDKDKHYLEPDSVELGVIRVPERQLRQRNSGGQHQQHL